MPNRYGVPEIESRRPAEVGRGGQPTVNAGMDINQLFAAALGSESYGRALNEAVRQLIGGRQAMGTMMARSGVAPGAAQYAHQSAARTPMVQPRVNPAIEMLAASQLQRGQSNAVMTDMEQRIAAAQPSGMDRAMGFAIPALGMMIGGPVMGGSWAGASAGGQFGGMLSQMLRGY